jgi:hypothetical protein
MAVRRFDLEELEKKFEPYDCKMVAVVCCDPLLELWVTGWNEPFTLTPEDGYYNDFEWNKFLFLVGATMPVDWRKK